MTLKKEKEKINKFDDEEENIEGRGKKVRKCGDPLGEYFKHPHSI